MKKKIIISIIVIIALIILLSIFFINKNKKIYITKSNDIDTIKISMLKVENGLITVIKQVPITGSWEMKYDCDDQSVEIYWDESNRKILVKNIKETSCVIKFLEPTSSFDVIAIYVDDLYVAELNNDLYYRLLSYNCSNNETVNWNSSKNALTITPLKKNTRCNLYFEEGLPEFDRVKLVNKPVLVTGMTPVKWTGTPGNYVESTTTEADPDWYDYSQKKWANVKTEDGSYWVWIPRYAYKITSGFHSSTVGTIDIKFLMGQTNKFSDGTIAETSGYDFSVKNTSTHYFVHPAFKFGEDDLTGIWIAKYESSNTTTQPAFKPSVTSLRSATPSTMFDSSFNMKNITAYGWNGTNIDTHMIKNTEWGAVAYLTHSSYGANQEVWINNNSNYMTGCAGNSVSEAAFAGCQNAYNTVNGVKASTTHNITGIYDMSGGAHEFTSSYVNNGNSSLSTYGSSILGANAKYKDVYPITTDSQTNNYAAAKNIYGDAIYETSLSYTGTSSWNADSSSMLYSSNAFSMRSGNNASATGAGLFLFWGNSGASNPSIGFRVTLVIP